jgi:hypothetical protein
MDRHYCFAKAYSFFGGRDNVLKLHNLQHCWSGHERNTFRSDAVRDDGEMTMQIQEQTTEIIGAGTDYTPSWTSSEQNSNLAREADVDLTPRAYLNSQTPRMFEYSAQTTLAERFPRLTCFAISFGLLASALITEVECLKGSGYFWR